MSVKKNYIYNTANQLLTMIVSIITVPYVSRILGATNIGIYSYTYSIVSYFVMFIALGLNNYGNREIAKKKDSQEDLRKTFSSIYLMQLITGIIVIVAYIGYILIFVHKYQIMFYIQIIYILAAILDINWAMYGLEVFKFTAIRNMIISVFNLIFILLFVRDENSLYIYTFILAAGVLANQIAAWVFVRKHIKFIRVSFSEIVRHIKPNIILFIPIVAVSLYKIMDKIMLGTMVDMTQVGYYESSEKIIRIPTILISSLGMVMLPRMANLFAKHEVNKSETYIRKSIDVAMILSSSLCFGIMAVSKEFVPLFYGPGYDTCITIYISLLPSCLFLAFSNVIRTQFLIPTARDKIFIKAVITGAVVNIVVNLLLIPRLYAVGAAIGTLLAECAVCVSQIIDVRRELPVKNYIVRSMPFTILGLLMFGLVYFINFQFSPFMSLVIKIIIGTLIYVIGLVIILKVFYKTYELDLLKFVKRR